MKVANDPAPGPLFIHIETYAPQRLSAFAAEIRPFVKLLNELHASAKSQFAAHSRHADIAVEKSKATRFEMKMAALPASLRKKKPFGLAKQFGYSRGPTDRLGEWFIARAYEIHSAIGWELLDSLAALKSGGPTREYSAHVAAAARHLGELDMLLEVFENGLYESSFNGFHSVEQMLDAGRTSAARRRPQAAHVRNQMRARRDALLQSGFPIRGTASRIAKEFGVTADWVRKALKRDST